MNPDGSAKKKILNIGSNKIYFYKDSNRFVYVDGTSLYKTDTTGTSNEFIVDYQTLSSSIALEGFNPISEELLFLIDSTLAAFNVNTKSLKILYTEGKRV